jgi:hypothetical protein
MKAFLFKRKDFRFFLGFKGFEGFFGDWKSLGLGGI